MNRRKKKNLYIQIVVIYGVFILLPITLVFTMFSFRTVNDIKKSYVAFMKENNYQLDERVNLIMKDIDRISSISVIDKEARLILEKKYKTEAIENRYDTVKMNELISTTSVLSSLFYEVIFVSRGGDMFTNLSAVPSIQSDKILNEWIPTIKADKNERVISDIYISNNDEKYISVYRKILNSVSYKVSGYVFVNIKLKELQKHFRGKNHQEEYVTNTMILNQKDIVFHSKTEANVSEEHLSQLTEAIQLNWDILDHSEMEFVIDGQAYLVVGTRNDTTGWYIVQYTAQKHITKYASKALVYIFGVMFPILLLFLGFGYYFSKRIIAPVHRLKCSMEKVEENVFEQVDSKDKMAAEIHELIESYNSMVISLERNIYQKYILEMNKRAVELKMLQAQINPHFLFNTLNLISSMAELEGFDPIKEVTNCLARMFRYNVKQGDLVTIREELDQIEYYMTIQQMRFFGKFDFKYTITKEIETLIMLKFLFQPIIENAIYHGLENKKGYGKIEMNFVIEEGILVIRIMDDGVGMSEETCQRIQNKLSDKKEVYFNERTDDHIGLENIHFRIKNYYGEGYGLLVQSKAGVGTDITIRIPIIRKEMI